ncbi:MAG: hypothetical protein KDD66_00655 [Bdellovibrionales bacterium]|nr:hypothetical protein [Bdellovibrionales bacterium]
MKSSKRRGSRQTSSSPLHLLVFPTREDGKKPTSTEMALALLRNPVAAAIECVILTSVIVSSASGAGTLASVLVSIPMGIAAGCAVYILKLRPDFLERIRPSGEDLSNFQRLQLFSICFILGLAFFGQGVFGAQFVEQIFGHVKFFTGFLIIAVGFAGLMLGQLTAILFFQDQRKAAPVFDLEIAEPVVAELESHAEEAVG